MAVVTVSAAYGARGSEIAPALAERLGARFVDRAIPADVAARLDVPLEEALARDESAGGLLERMLGGLAAAGGLYGVAPVEPQLTADAFQLETEKRIREEAERGDAVLLGRAGALVLAGRPGVLHVRLDGPPAARTAQAARLTGTDPEEAERRRRETDRAREAYVRHFYGADARDPALYHLVLDATAIAPAACVEAICAALLGLALG